jgi:prepilin-type N-terminal cleavage/methylation domain-containing protein
VRCPAGFTLIELLVVIAVIGNVVTISNRSGALFLRLVK